MYEATPSDQISALAQRCRRGMHGAAALCLLLFLWYETRMGC